MQDIWHPGRIRSRLRWQEPERSRMSRSRCMIGIPHGVQYGGFYPPATFRRPGGFVMRFWAMYAACTALIVFSGAKLSRYGDILAGKTGLGRTWIGVILMASVTSLPELITGLGSVTYAGVPDIAVGNVLGSCTFNMLILALLDVLHRPLPLSARARHGHTLTAGFGILLLCIATVGLFLQGRDRKS